MIKDRKHNINNKIHALGIVVFVVTAAFLLKIIYAQVIGSFLEADLIWLVPKLIQRAGGMSFLRTAGYILFDFEHWLHRPELQVYLLSVSSFFGPLARNLIAISVIFHLFNAVLLIILCRELGLIDIAGLSAGLIYLALFAPFHAYMYPPAFQHLAVIFFTLLGLILYLETDRRINENSSHALFFVATFIICLLSSFCRASILILPAVIFAHIIFSAADDNDRFRKYGIWLPLFIIYLIYPLFSLIAGDFKFDKLLRQLSTILTGDNNRSLSAAGFNINLKFIFAFISGLAGLFLTKRALALQNRQRKKIILKWSFIAAAAAIITVLFVSGGLRRILIPFNIMAPFAGILGSFLCPAQKSMAFDPARDYYYIPLQVNLFLLLSALLTVFIFICKIIPKYKGLVILPAWYLFSMLWLYGSDPIPSRYFIYLSPVFCIVLASVLYYLYSEVIRPSRLKGAAGDFILLLLVFLLCIPNVLAIRIALYRGKLANNFLMYDYIRAADAIEEDIAKNNLRQASRREVYINNIIPTTFDLGVGFSFSDLNNDSARFVFLQRLDKEHFNLIINQPPSGNGEAIVYSLSSNGCAINNASGQNIIKFFRLFEAAQEKLKSGRYPEAAALFREAIEERPYLFRYLLGKLELEDLQWIYGPQDMRSWIKDIACYQAAGHSRETIPKIKYIHSIMDREVDEYIQCLFYLSYLKEALGSPNESRYWFSRIGILEVSYERLRSLLSGLPLVKSDKNISVFLSTRGECSLYRIPDDYADRHKFGKFLLGINS